MSPTPAHNRLLALQSYLEVTQMLETLKQQRIEISKKIGEWTATQRECHAHLEKLLRSGEAIERAGHVYWLDRGELCQRKLISLDVQPALPLTDHKHKTPSLASSHTPGANESRMPFYKIPVLLSAPMTADEVRAQYAASVADEGGMVYQTCANCGHIFYTLPLVESGTARHERCEHCH